MFKTATTFVIPVEDILNDASRKSHEFYDFLTWILDKSDRDIASETLRPDQIHPDTIIRIWKKEEHLNYYLEGVNKFFGDVADVVVIK